MISFFNQAWSELFCPPVRLSLKNKKRLMADEPRFSAVDGIVYVTQELIPRGADPKEYLLWFFRHELSHVHHCPYDIKTAYSLEQAAHSVVGNWSLAYLATHIFSDAQIDVNYLPNRFGEIPYTTLPFGKKPNFFADQILQAVYSRLNSIPNSKRSSKEIVEAAQEIFTIMVLNRTWHTKVKMIAYILNRLRNRNSNLFSNKRMTKYIKDNPLIVREDFQHSSVQNFTETYGSITNEQAAKEFYKQWLEPRLNEDEEERIEEMLKKNVKGRKKGTRKTKEKPKQKESGPEGVDRKDILDSGNPPSINLLGDEPRLPTSLSKPYGKIGAKSIEETMWKRYWFKSRAKNTIIQYLLSSRRRRPVWSIRKYPDEWYIEDEIEDLDIETSLDEGPIIPEVTTLKWVEEPTPFGQSMASGFVPSALVVLDASLSMTSVRNDASVASFISYLSALRAGGQTATIAFSTGYIVADWDNSNEMKELALSMSFGEYTIFPSQIILELLAKNQGPSFVVIITDGGWQNIEESIPILEKISSSGNKIVIFLLKGGEYQDRIELITRTPDLRLFKISEPESDLQGMVLSESMKTYETYLI